MYASKLNYFIKKRIYDWLRHNKIVSLPFVLWRWSLFCLSQNVYLQLHETKRFLKSFTCNIIVPYYSHTLGFRQTLCLNLLLCYIKVHKKNKERNKIRYLKKPIKYSEKYIKFYLIPWFLNFACNFTSTRMCFTVIFVHGYIY